MITETTLLDICLENHLSLCDISFQEMTVFSIRINLLSSVFVVYEMWILSFEKHQNHAWAIMKGKFFHSIKSIRASIEYQGDRRIFISEVALLFVYCDVIFEPLQAEVVGYSIQHTCVLLYIVHLGHLRCGVSEQVSYLFDCE